MQTFFQEKILEIVKSNCDFEGFHCCAILCLSMRKGVCPVVLVLVASLVCPIIGSLVLKSVEVPTLNIAGD